MRKRTGFIQLFVMLNICGKQRKKRNYINIAGKIRLAKKM